MKRSLFLFLLLGCIKANSQGYSSWLMDINIGTGSYNGDLVQGESPFQRLRFAGGANIHNKYNNHIFFRGGLHYAYLF
jgi:hypothetical protein